MPPALTSEAVFAPWCTVRARIPRRSMWRTGNWCVRYARADTGGREAESVAMRPGINHQWTKASMRARWSAMYAASARKQRGDAGGKCEENRRWYGRWMSPRRPGIRDRMRIPCVGGAAGTGCGAVANGRDELGPTSCRVTHLGARGCDGGYGGLGYWGATSSAQRRRTEVAASRTRLASVPSPHGPRVLGAVMARDRGSAFVEKRQLEPKRSGWLQGGCVRPQRKAPGRSVDSSGFHEKGEESAVGGSAGSRGA